MKKTITLYELLGLIKDDKAPKKIKYEDKIYTFYDFVCGYYEEGFAGINNKKFLTFRNEQYYKVLNDEVEIISDEEEFEDVEEFKEYKFINTRDILELEMLINKINADYNYKINQLIRNQKKIIERLK